MSAEQTVHIVDDDEAVRDSLVFLLESHGVHARPYGSAKALLARCGSLEPGCILTDVKMPEIGGLELATELRERRAPHPIIVLTGHADVSLAVKAMKAGVADFLEKPYDDEALLRAVHAGLACSDEAATRAEERSQIKARLATLTDRERQVFDAIVAGDSNKVAAQKMGISPRTVEIYRANAMQKMGASNLSELVRMALRVEEA